MHEVMPQALIAVFLILWGGGGCTKMWEHVSEKPRALYLGGLARIKVTSLACLVYH